MAGVMPHTLEGLGTWRTPVTHVRELWLRSSAFGQWDCLSTCSVSGSVVVSAPLNCDSSLGLQALDFFKNFLVFID